MAWSFAVCTFLSSTDYTGLSQACLVLRWYRYARSRLNTVPEQSPRGSIYTTIMELGPQSHNGDGLLGPNSIRVVYMDPLGQQSTKLLTHVGGSQNYGPFLGTLNNKCRIIIGTQKGTLFDNHPCNTEA